MRDIRFIVGNQEIFNTIVSGEGGKIYAPYDEMICDFFQSLSREIMKDGDAKQYADVISFGFWCRRNNINNMKEQFMDGKIRVGRGLVFHIAPSNVPVNSFFTLAFGLLAGNINILRIPTKEYPQIKILCDCLSRVLDREYQELRNNICIVSYDRRTDWTATISEKCMARVIWGGDDTIRYVMKTPIPTRAVELHFSDRYSFAVLSAQAVLKATDHELNQLANGFYNDTYLMDQNACSSPQLLCWIQDTIYVEEAKERFYKFVVAVTGKYDLADIKCTEKYTMAVENAMLHDAIESTREFGNVLYLQKLKYIPKQLENIRGKFGLFYEFETESISELGRAITEKTQTCLYYGLDSEDLWKEFQKSQVAGIDRIVPIGSGLEISVIWDGYDVVKELSRIVYLG